MCCSLSAAAAATPKVYLRHHLSTACSFKSSHTGVTFTWDGMKGGNDGLSTSGGSSSRTSRDSSQRVLRASALGPAAAAAGGTQADSDGVAGVAAEGKLGECAKQHEA